MTLGLTTLTKEQSEARAAAQAAYDEQVGRMKAEVHPRLNSDQLREIQKFRMKLEGKLQPETERIVYEWAVTRKLTMNEHRLLCIYVFTR